MTTYPQQADAWVRAKGRIQLEDNRIYYRRRAAEEAVAAEHAASSSAAAVHRSLAERYSALAGESQPLAPQAAATIET